MKGDFGFQLGESAHGLREMAEIDRAAKFPVGDRLQADLLLQPDRIANAAVLDFAQPFRRERARLELPGVRVAIPVAAGDSRYVRREKVAPHGAARCPGSRSVLGEVHHRDGAADREDRDRCVEPQFARGALCGTGECDEGANLQSTLPCVAPGFLVPVCEQRLTVIAEEALQELPVPGLVDLSRVRRGMASARCHLLPTTARRSDARSQARRNARPNS